LGGEESVAAIQICLGMTANPGRSMLTMIRMRGAVPIMALPVVNGKNRMGFAKNGSQQGSPWSSHDHQTCL